MKSHHRICKVLLTLFCFLFMNVDAMAQIEVGVEAIPPADQNSQWEINVAFVPVPTPEKIKQVFLISIENAKVIKLKNFGPNPSNRRIYTGTLSEPLETVERQNPHSIGFSGGQLSSYGEGSSALDFPLIHDARSQDPS